MHHVKFKQLFFSVFYSVFEDTIGKTKEERQLIFDAFFKKVGYQKRASYHEDESFYSESPSSNFYCNLNNNLEVTNLFFISKEDKENGILSIDHMTSIEKEERRLIRDFKLVFSDGLNDFCKVEFFSNRIFCVFHSQKCTDPQKFTRENYLLSDDDAMYEILEMTIPAMISTCGFHKMINFLELAKEKTK